MASKPPKLFRAAAEALEQGNLKVALRRSEAALQQHPSNSLCVALRAATLEFSGFRAEALLLCREVAAQKPVEAQVLGYLCTVLQRASLFTEATALFDTAFQASDTEENGVSLFLALASECSFARQQQVAQVLYRRFKKVRYLLWAVGAILLQASPGPRRSLDLAETLLQRAPVDMRRNSNEMEEATRRKYGVLLVELATLRQQAQHRKALELLDAHEVELPLKTDAAALRLQLLAESGCKREAVATARARYLAQPEQWQAAREFVFAVFWAEGFFETPMVSSRTPRSPENSIERPTRSLLGFAGLTGVPRERRPASEELISRSLAQGGRSSSLQGCSTSEETVGDAFILLKSMQCNAEHVNRTSHLAEIEMRALAFACNQLEVVRASCLGEDIFDTSSWMSVMLADDVEDFLEAIVFYFRRYGHCGGCYHELKSYLCLLDNTHGARLLETLRDADEKRGTAATETSRDWEACCEGAQRSLAFARLQWSLRGLEGMPLERCVREVDALLQCWSQLQLLAAESASVHGSIRSQRREHALPNELRGTLETADLLCIAVAHLLDMDRSFCTQVVCEMPTIPSMSDRTYLFDALVLLELSAKVGPLCPRTRLLCAVLYGSIGAALPLKRWYELSGLSRQQQGALAHIVLDPLLTFGWWEDLPEYCKRIRQYHGDLVQDTRMALAHACAHNDGLSMDRSRELMRTLESVERSVVRGRVCVEEALVSVMQLPVCDGLDFLAEQVEGLREIASRPGNFWEITDVQDRWVFKSLYTVPRCTPLQALRAGTIGAPLLSWRRLGAASMPPEWTASLRPHPCEIVRSVLGTSWPLNLEASDAPLGLPEVTRPPSGLEELLSSRREGSVLLKLRAQSLLLVHAMLRSSPSKEELSELLADVQKTLASERLVDHCDAQQPFTMELLAVDAPVRTERASMFANSGKLPLSRKREGIEATWIPPWRPAVTEADDLFWRCAFLACDCAHLCLQAEHVASVSAEEPGLPEVTPLQQQPQQQQQQHVPVSPQVAPWRMLHPTLPAHANEDIVGALVSPIACGPARDAVQRSLCVLRILVKECGKVVLGQPTPSKRMPAAATDGASHVTAFHGAAFCLGGGGLPVLSAFVTGPLLTLVPALFLMSTILRPLAGLRVGPRKSTKRWPFCATDASTLDAARRPLYALDDLAETLMGVLKEILKELQSARQETFDHFGEEHDLPWVPPLSFLRNTSSVGLCSAADLLEVRRTVSRTIVVSHRRQLGVLEECLMERLKLLKNLTEKLKPRQ